MEKSRDQILLERFQENPEKAFPDVFQAYYSLMCNQVYRILGNPSEVEDVVQDIFLELWRKKRQLKINTSMPAYLKSMARTRTLNSIRDKKMRWKETEDVLLNVESKSLESADLLEFKDFESMVNNALEKLPPKCKIVFGLSRYEEMTNKEIAAQLEISPKTVENQITRALKKIKSAISHYKTKHDI